MSHFNYEIEYIQASENQIADWLSRSADTSNHTNIALSEEIVINALSEEGKKDLTTYGNSMRNLVNIFQENNWTKEKKDSFFKYWRIRDRITITEGKLFVDRVRLIPDESVRENIIKNAHESHQGMNKTCSRVQEWFWWPAWRKEVIEKVKDCSTCQESDRTAKIQETPLYPVQLPNGPWQKLAVDIKGPIAGEKRNRFLIVIKDYYSKWPIVIGTSRITSKVVERAFRETFSIYGLPQELVSDNGKQFISRELSKYLEENGIKHRKVAIYSPRQNGLVERFNRSLSEKIKEAGTAKRSMYENIQNFVEVYRITPHSLTGISPFEALFNRKPRTKLKIFYPEGERGNEGIIDKDLVRKRQEKMKENFDRRSGAKNRPFKIGEIVRPRNPKGQFEKRQEIIEIGKSTVTLRDRRKWPINKISR